MYQVLKMSGTLYATDVSKLDDEEIMDRIRSFGGSSTASIMVEDLDDLSELGIDPSDLTMIDLDE